MLPSSRRPWQNPPPPNKPSRLFGQLACARIDIRRRLPQFETLKIGQNIEKITDSQRRRDVVSWWQAVGGVPFLISLPFQGILVTSSSSKTYLLAFLEMVINFPRSAWSLLKNCDHMAARSFSERFSYRITTWTRETKASSKWPTLFVVKNRIPL